jgi:O-antigen ligase
VIWSVSQELVRKRPLLGFGMGGFAPAYKEAIQKTSYTGWASTPITDPHNQYLFVQLEAGVVGTAAFAWFLVACFRHRGEAPYRAWGRSVLLAWCAASLATSLFSNASEGHMVMLTLGVLLSAPTVPRQSTANSFAEGKALGGRTTA